MYEYLMKTRKYFHFPSKIKIRRSRILEKQKERLLFLNRWEMKMFSFPLKKFNAPVNTQNDFCPYTNIYQMIGIRLDKDR